MKFSIISDNSSVPYPSSFQLFETKSRYNFINYYSVNAISTQLS